MDVLRTQTFRCLDLAVRVAESTGLWEDPGIDSSMYHAESLRQFRAIARTMDGMGTEKAELVRTVMAEALTVNLLRFDYYRDPERWEALEDATMKLLGSAERLGFHPMW